MTGKYKRHSIFGVLFSKIAPFAQIWNALFSFAFLPKKLSEPEKGFGSKNATVLVFCK